MTMPPLVLDNLGTRGGIVVINSTDCIFGHWFPRHLCANVDTKFVVHANSFQSRLRTSLLPTMNSDPEVFIAFTWVAEHSNLALLARKTR